MIIEDLSGNRYGSLTVTGLSSSHNKGKLKWNCTCDCGNNLAVQGSNLKNGHSRSCGCLRISICIKLRKTHGQTRTTLYNIWMSMKARCRNINSYAYKDYGGRGIDYCERWSSFENFAMDMGPRPLGKQIDRIDNNKGYSPENCRWVTASENQRNKRDSTFITHEGITLTIAGWAEKIGCRQGILGTRKLLGWSDERIITQPIRRHRARPE